MDSINVRLILLVGVVLLLIAVGGSRFFRFALIR